MKIRRDVFSRGVTVVAILGTLVYNLFQYAYFRQKLAGYTPLLSPVVRAHLPIVVLTGELVIIASLCIGRNRRLWHWVTYYAIFGATAFLVYWVAKPYDPDCDCGGLIKLATRMKYGNIMVLARNVVLMALLWFGAYTKQTEANMKEGQT